MWDRISNTNHIAIGVRRVLDELHALRQCAGIADSQTLAG